MLVPQSPSDHGPEVPLGCGRRQQFQYGKSMAEVPRVASLWDAGRTVKVGEAKDRREGHE